MKRLYDVEDMQSALEEAINHINSAMTELDGMVEYQDEVDDLISIRNGLKQLQEETDDIMQKQWADEQKELEREFDKTRI